jgi:hypothetical protein
MAGIQIDGVNNKIDFDDDLDTSISANTDDTLVIEAGGVNIASITAGEFAINEGSADIDFRVESNGNANALFINAGDDLIDFGVSGAGHLRPSFSAHKNSTGQTIANDTTTKVTFETEVLDSDDKFASSRFTPTIAGQYFFAATVALTNLPVNAYCAIYVYKNGSASFSQLAKNNSDSDETDTGKSASWVFDMDADDYVEIFIRHNASGNEDTRVGQEITFSGYRIN